MRKLQMNLPCPPPRLPDPLFESAHESEVCGRPLPLWCGGMYLPDWHTKMAISSQCTVLYTAWKQILKKN